MLCRYNNDNEIWNTYKTPSVAYFYLHTDLFYICARATILIALHIFMSIVTQFYPIMGSPYGLRCQSPWEMQTQLLFVHV